MPPDSVSHRRLARHTLWNLAGYVLPLVVALIALPPTVRWLGPERYGLLALVLLAHDYFGYFDFGLGRAATRALVEALHAPASDANPRAVLRTSVVLHVAVGGGLALLFVALVPFVTPFLLHGSAEVVAEGGRTLLAAGLFGPVLLLLIVARGGLEALQRFDLVNAVKVPSNALTYVIPLAGAYWGFSLPVIVLLLVLSRLVTGLIYLALCRSRLPRVGPEGFDRRLVSSLFSVGGWIMAANLAGLVLVDGDRLLISALTTVDRLTYYSIPQDVTTRLWILPASVASALFPVFALARPEFRDRLAALYTDSTLYMLVLFVPAVLLTTSFGPELLGLWMGSAFSTQAALVLQLIMFGVMLDGLARVPLTLFQASGDAGLPARVRWWLVPPFLAASAWAISRHGIVGAAVVWSVRIAVEAGVLFFLAARRGQVSLPPAAESRLVRGAAASALALGVGAMLEWVWRPPLAVELVVVAALGLGFGWYAWRSLVAPEHRGVVLARLGLSGEA